MEMLVRFADGRNVQHAVLQKEGNRTIHEIDLWMLREAESTLALSADDKRLAVNISPVTIERHYTELLDIIDHFRARPTRLVFEITETAPILEPHCVTSFAMSAQAAGMAIALDDYGNGFCDASRLMLVQPNYIKVAKTGRGGWRAMPERERRALRSIANAMRVPLIGEGVESANDLEEIRSLGFDFGQGYYLATEVIAEHNTLTAGTAAVQSTGKRIASPLT
jgi:EAL domain-containing protein (putative c-di-GMP-specific phosphodiesterase class I)